MVGEICQISKPKFPYACSASTANRLSDYMQSYWPSLQFGMDLQNLVQEMSQKLHLVRGKEFAFS